MAKRDINIKASLEKTTATGPGPLQVPTLNIDKYDLPQIPTPQAYQMQQMALQQPMMQQRMPQMSLNDRMLARYGQQSGGLNSAPQQRATGPGGVPYGMVPTYVKPSTGFNMGGGMRPATGNEPGAVFAGYVPQSAMPQQVAVAGMGGPSPAGLGPQQQQLPIQLQNQLAALPPAQRAQLMALLGGG